MGRRGTRSREGAQAGASHGRPRARRAAGCARALAAAAALAFAALAGAAGWAGPARADPPAAPFHSADGAFTAHFPVTPRHQDARSRTLLGTLRTQSWEVEQGSLRLRVERHDVPALALRLLGAKAMLERAAGQLLRDLDARGALAEAASWRGRPGHHLRYEPGAHPGAIEDAWLYLLGTRIYVIFARGGDAETRAAAARFAASVELHEE